MASPALNDSLSKLRTLFLDNNLGEEGPQAMAKTRAQEGAGLRLVLSSSKIVLQIADVLAPPPLPSDPRNKKGVQEMAKKEKQN